MLLSNLKDKIKGTVFKNYLYLLMIQGANFILPLITIPYLVRTLGVNKFGIVMVAQSFAILLTIVTEFGLDMSATRQVALIKDDKKKVSQYFFDVFFFKNAFSYNSLYNSAIFHFYYRQIFPRIPSVFL